MPPTGPSNMYRSIHANPVHVLLSFTLLILKTDGSWVTFKAVVKHTPVTEFHQKSCTRQIKNVTFCCLFWLTVWAKRGWTVQRAGQDGEGGRGERGDELKLMRKMLKSWKSQEKQLWDVKQGMWRVRCFSEPMCREHRDIDFKTIGKMELNQTLCYCGNQESWTTLF